MTFWPKTDDTLNALKLQFNAYKILCIPQTILGIKQIRLHMNNGFVFRIRLEQKDLKRKDWFYSMILCSINDSHINDIELPSSGKSIYVNCSHMQNAMELLLNRMYENGVYPIADDYTCISHI